MRGKVTNDRVGGIWRRAAIMPLGIALLGALGLGGCVPDYLTLDDSEVTVFITAINGNSPLLSDVRADDGTVAPDAVIVSFAVRHKNLRNEAPQIPQAVFLERYEVSYRRSDGRALEGEDVPFRITGGLTVVEDVRESGGADFVLTIVRAQAKLESPLMNLRAPEQGDPFQPEAGGGAIVLTVFADVTLHGRTVADRVIRTSGTLQIDFADWEG